MNLLLFVFGLVVIGRVACFEIISPDLFWHLKMGEDFWANGLSPFVDHYSFTYPNAPIKMVAWPFQGLIYFLYTLFGWAGIDLFRFLAWGTALFFLLKILKERETSSVLKTMATLLFLLIVIFRSEPRPELLSLALETFTLWLCLQWRKKNDGLSIIFLAALLLCWTNYHMTAVLGYVCVGAFLAERFAFLAIKKGSLHKWLYLISISIFLVGVGFLNHDFGHPLLLPRYMSPEWVKYIGEYTRKPFSAQELYLQIYWVLAVLIIPALMIEKEWAGFIIVLVMGINTWSMTKLYPHFIALTLPFVCQGLSFYGRCLSEKKAFLLQKVLGPAVFGILSLIFVWQIVVALILKPVHPTGIRIDPNFYPADTVSYMKEQHYSGRVINEYGLGGYLLYSLAPSVQVYIDGRTSILYPIEFMKSYMKLISDSATLIDATKKYHVDWVIENLEKPDELIDTTLNSGAFALEFVGKNSALLSHNFKRFPVASMSVLHPQCLMSSNAVEIRREFNEAHVLLPLESPLLHFLELADKYFSVKDKSNFFNLADADVTGSTYTMRLAAYLAQKEKRGDVALFYYTHIPRPSQDDKINSAEADCEFNFCKNAEAILNTVTAPGLRESHIYRAYKILEKLKARGDLKIFTEERLEKNKLKINKYLQSQTSPPEPEWCALRRLHF